MKIKFEKVTVAHLDSIFSWLTEPHVMEFWDNTQAHKDDIVNFAEGRKTPSSYAGGGYVYWIAYLEDEPFAMLMSIQETHKEDIGPEKLKRLSKTGNTYGLDYMIGNPKFCGKGYGSQTLSDFIDFFRESIDPKADTFLIDPDSANLRAKHVYMKAGFKHVCDFMMEGDVSGAGKIHHLLIRKFEPDITYEVAKHADFNPINMIYDEVNFVHSHPDNDKVILAKINDEIIGLGRLVHIDQGNAELGGIYVKEAWRARGIANNIVQNLLELGTQYQKIWCLPFQKLLHFYQKFGFQNLYSCSIPESILQKHNWCNDTYDESVELLVLEQTLILINSSKLDVMNDKSFIPTPDLARKLIAEQFPEYDRLPITDVEKQGHDNRTYRLGDHMLIRMPTAADYALKVPKEQELLPQLAKCLSVSIPAPIKMGKPSADYPYPFSIYKWLSGKSINLLTLTDQEKEQLAFDLAKFLKELQAITDIEGPEPGQHNWWRGDHVSVYDKGAREQIAELDDVIDVTRALALWDKACATRWNKQPIWIHGDFAIGNILMDGGKLSAVIDFGGAAVGDPACDLVIAWTYLSGKAREIFMSGMDMDPDTWLRARAWALWKATFELCEIADKNSAEAGLQKRIIYEVMNG